MVNGKWEMGNGKWLMGNRKWLMGNKNLQMFFSTVTFLEDF